MNIILNLTAEQVSIITMYMAESSGKSIVSHADIQEKLQYNVDNQIKDWSHVVGKTEEEEITTPLWLQNSKTV